MHAVELTVQSGGVNAENCNIVFNLERAPLWVNSDVVRVDALTASEQEVRSKHSCETWGCDNSVTVAMSSGHDPGVGDEDSSADGLEDDKNSHQKANLQNTIKKL